MLTATLTEADVIGPQGGWLYESPLWDHRRQRFLWADIEAGHVHEYDPASGRLSRHDVGELVACIALRASGGYLLALRHSVAIVNEAFGSLEVVCDVADLPADVRFNDGAVAPDGSFWVGTLSHTRDAAGSLYRLSPDHSATELLGGVSISNGMDWSGDGSNHYYVDSGPGTVELLRSRPAERAADWAVTDREPFFRTGAGEGSPDGLAVDADDHVWVALWGAGRIVRLTPDGEVVAEVLIPAPCTSSIAFGGPDLRDLYITTAREDLSQAELLVHPLSGSVFRWRAPVQGRPSGLWAG